MHCHRTQFYVLQTLLTKQTSPAEESIPTRENSMGKACTECELERIKGISSDKWDEIVPITALRPGYEDTRLNFQKVSFSDV